MKGIVQHAKMQSKFSDVYFYQFSYHGQLGGDKIYLPGKQLHVILTEINNKITQKMFPTLKIKHLMKKLRRSTNQDFYRLYLVYPFYYAFSFTFSYFEWRMLIGRDFTYLSNIFLITCIRNLYDDILLFQI